MSETYHHTNILVPSREDATAKKKTASIASKIIVVNVISAAIPRQSGSA